VKSLRPSYWEEFRRMIPPKQLAEYVKKDAIVIWTTATGDCYSGSVCIKGWNYAKEVQEKGLAVKTVCDNIWLKDDALMRDLTSLFEMMSDVQLLLDVIQLGY